MITLKLFHRRLPRLGDALCPDDPKRGHDQDAHIEPEPDILDVPDIEFEALLPGHEIPSVDLSPPGNPGPDFMPAGLAPKMAPSKRLKGVCFCSWENSEEVEDAVLFGKGPSAPTYVGPAPRVPIMAERAWTGSSTSKADLLSRVGVRPAK